jgi:hypothetical protein
MLMSINWLLTSGNAAVHVIVNTARQTLLFELRELHEAGAQRWAYLPVVSAA